MVQIKPTERQIRRGGGIYVYRTRKPGSFFGIFFSKHPLRWYWWIGGTVAACIVNGFVTGVWWLGLMLLLFTGRHFGYVGETVSFVDRHAEHINGGGRWKAAAKPWADLDPVCVLRIPLPKWKWLLRSTETLVMALTWPVYNHKKNLWNLRRIPLMTARVQRAKRNRRKHGWSFNFRSAHLLVIVALVIVVIAA